MREDEERHQRVFEIFAEALTDDGRFMPGETEETLAAKVRDVGEVFLPRRLRTDIARENPLGNGGRVWALRGETSEAKLPLFRKLLDEAGLRAGLEARATALGKKKVSDLTVAVKPTFMLGYHRKDMAPVTDPTLVDELTQYLNECGCTDIALVEQRNIYDNFYHNRSVADVAHYLGFDSKHYRVVDASEEQVPQCYQEDWANTQSVEHGETPTFASRSASCEVIRSSSCRFLFRTLTGSARVAMNLFSSSGRRNVTPRT